MIRPGSSSVFKQMNGMGWEGQASATGVLESAILKKFTVYNLAGHSRCPDVNT